MSEELPAGERIDLVLFEVAGISYVADLLQVRRIDAPDEGESVGAPLGAPATGHRALVFGPSADAERRLTVDQVHGVHRVPVGDLRRMPRVAGAPPMSVGAWIDGEKAVVIIDLHALLTA